MNILQIVVAFACWCHQTHAGPMLESEPFERPYSEAYTGEGAAADQKTNPGSDQYAYNYKIRDEPSRERVGRLPSDSKKETKRKREKKRDGEGSKIAKPERVEEEPKRQQVVADRARAEPEDILPLDAALGVASKNDYITAAELNSLLSDSVTANAKEDVSKEKLSVEKLVAAAGGNDSNAAAATDKAAAIAQIARENGEQISDDDLQKLLSSGPGVENTTAQPPPFGDPRKPTDGGNDTHPVEAKPGEGLDGRSLPGGIMIGATGPSGEVGNSTASPRSATAENSTEAESKNKTWGKAEGLNFRFQVSRRLIGIPTEITPCLLKALAEAATGDKIILTTTGVSVKPLMRDPEKNFYPMYSTTWDKMYDAINQICPVLTEFVSSDRNPLSKEFEGKSMKGIGEDAFKDAVKGAVTVIQTGDLIPIKMVLHKQDIK